MFIEFENKIKIANNIAVFIDFYWKRDTQLEILYLYYMKKKIGAYVFWAGKLRHFKRMLLTEFQKKPWRMRIFLGNSLDEKSWLALTKRIFCWKIFQRTERKSQQFCFTGLLLDSTLVQSDKKKGFWKCDELSLKVDFSGDCCKNLSSTSALRFSLTWKIITLKCLWLTPTSVIQQSVKNNTNKNNQQMNQTQLVLHSNNLANVIKHEFYHTDKVQLLKFNSFRISLHFCIYTLRWNTLTSFVCIPNQ